VIVAGIDWSSKAIDVALIPLEPDHGDPTLERVTLRREAIPQIDPLERPYYAAQATAHMLQDVAGYPVVDVFVEEPWTRSWIAAAAMFPVYGAILASGRLHRRNVHALSSNQWRALLDLPSRLEKSSAIDDALVREPSLPRTITDHAAESYLIAVAGRLVVRRDEGVA
jgi:hypothetical protein